MTTTITNTSGTARFFGFIPPHGKTLAIGQTVVIKGSVNTMQADERLRSQTALDSMHHAEIHGLIQVCEHNECESSSSEKGA